MAAYYKDGATLRTPYGLYYQDGGTLRTITEAWYQDGATLRKWWPAGDVYLAPVTRNASRIDPNDASVNFAMNNTVGNISTNANVGLYTVEYDWLLAGVSADYDCRMTMVSGTSFTGAALGTWLNCATPRTWGLTQSVVGAVSGVATFEIAAAGSGAALNSCSVSLSATVSPSEL